MNTPDARVVFVADGEDRATHEAVTAAGAELLVHSGRYSAKINRAAALTSTPYLFLGADDLRFYPGWFEAARARMVGPIKVVGTNDLGNPRVTAGLHATHFLVKREYVEQGTIDGQEGLLHEGYVHCYTDDEFKATAEWRGAYAMALDSIVEHLHPDWNKAERDSVYDVGRESFDRDGALCRSRRCLWS